MFHFRSPAFPRLEARKLVLEAFWGGGHGLGVLGQDLEMQVTDKKKKACRGIGISREGGTRST